MLIKKYIILMPFFVLMACNPFCADHTDKSSVQKQSHHERLTMPVIPAAITDVSNRNIYLAKHYWENMNVTTAYDKFSKEEIEQNFVNYLNLLQLLPDVEAANDLHILMDRVVKKTTICRHFISLFEKYLYEPESPFKNDEYYITVLEYVVKSPQIDDVNKIRPKYQLKMLYKNRVGNVAENFNYIHLSGRRSSLYNFKSQYILLFFYDPDCEHCQATIAEMKKSELINDLLLQGKTLKILAVYTEGNSKLWIDHADDLPAQWTNVSDQQQINLYQQYDLKALPTMYLLDQDKKVILKDASLESIEDYLYDHKK